jgi:hypothetical protein
VKGYKKMAAFKWFRVQINIGTWERNIYLYQTSANLFDLQYHWSYTSQMHGSLQETLDDFAEAFSRHHQLANRGLRLVVGTPAAVLWSEVQEARPGNQQGPYFDPP